MAQTFRELVHRYINFDQPSNITLPMEQWKYFFEKGREYERENGNNQISR